MKAIRLTENQLKRLIRESVENIIADYKNDPEKLRQIADSWKEIDDRYKRDELSDEMNAELDRNMSTYDLGSDMAHSYVMDDPMHRHVSGTTLRDRIKDTMGNGIR